jgi:ribosomal protein S27E
LEAQEQKAALAKRVGELEKEIAELKDWKREAERYQLTEIAPSIMARTLKSGMENGETPHKLCADCFEDNKKSFLYPGPYGTDILFRCNRCGSTLLNPDGGPPMRITRITRT